MALYSHINMAHILTWCLNCMTLFATDLTLIMFSIQNLMLGQCLTNQNSVLCSRHNDEFYNLP